MYKTEHGFPVPEADDCWECYWTMGRLHDGICPGLRIDVVKHFSPNATRGSNS